MFYEIKDIAEDPGWTDALERNQRAGGTLELPIILQGDRVYWGQVFAPATSFIKDQGATVL